MPVDFHNPPIELDRSDDHERPSVIGQSAIVARLADAAAPAAGTREGATGDWCRRLGAIHRRRDEAARLSAHGNEERTHARQLACDRRWPAVVEAMRTLISCYNEGIGEEALVLADTADGGDGQRTATVTARSGRILVMAVEDADLWVRASQDENGRIEGERWIGLNRTDEATASYVLQNWLAQ